MWCTAAQQHDVISVLASLCCKMQMSATQSLLCRLPAGGVYTLKGDSRGGALLPVLGLLRR